MDENESRHSIRVLRMVKGDKVNLIDGKGNLYEGIINDPDPTGCQVAIIGITRNFERRGYRLHIAISPVKNQDRFEWFVEKSVEIGVDEITPVICRNTEKHGMKRERLNNIIISAMKQSVKAFRPVLNESVTFNEFINSDHSGIRMIAHCSSGLIRNKIDQVYKKSQDAVILIGPEGDFSEAEINLASDKGFQSVHFGSSRLRTETAGIAACHSVYLINN
jgi:16S rRNA (uracil1498-N3)-methyltransferase